MTSVHKHTWELKERKPLEIIPNNSTKHLYGEFRKHECSVCGAINQSYTYWNENSCELKEKEK